MSEGPGARNSRRRAEAGDLIQRRGLLRAPFAMRIDVLTLFPEMFESVLGASILKRAAEPIAHPADPSNVRPPVASYHVTDIRAYTTDKHQKVDQAPYGGGPGMVIQCQPVWDAIEAVEAQEPRPPTRLVMSPQGERLTQPMVEQLARCERLLILAGHYEGFDDRVIEAIEQRPGGLRHISIGDYVLSGGELPAMVLIDAVVRLLPGALGHEQSAHYESFSPGQHGLLDHPHYTRPRTWQGRDVPEVLLSGDHGKIEQWRAEQSRRRTREHRPDLLEGASHREDVSAQERLVVVVREERKPDAPGVDRVLREAFPTADEAELVARLRQRGETPIALVAEAHPRLDERGDADESGGGGSGGGGGEVVGQITFSPVTLADQASVRGLLALAPVAVRPAWQKRGIGAALVREGLARCERARVRAVFVLGDPDYYQRFGFEPAAPLGFTSDFGSGPEFMVCRLGEALPEHMTGRIRFAEPFDALRPEAS